MQKTKVEPFKSKYKVERSAYRLDNETIIVHLRMLSPDEKRVEYFSYTHGRGYHQANQIAQQNKILIGMQGKMDKFLAEEKLNKLNAFFYQTKKLTF